MFLFEQELSRVNGNFICVSFALQKVLSTPQGQNMNLYYSYINIKLILNIFN